MSSCSSSVSDLKLAQPLTLPNGLVLPNRLIKAAMAEQLGFGNHLPNPELNAVYATWARGNWGMILTGNVQVDPAHKGDAHDIAPGHPGTTPEQTLTAFRAWADAALLKGQGQGEGEGEDGNGNGKGSKTPVVIQINHPGRQSPMGAGTRGLLEKAVAPSAVPLVLGEGLVPRLASKLLFGTPRELTVAEIKEIVRKFGATARLTAEAGFQGVEIHAAHGYLLAQFLSKKTNKRTDEYGGSAEKRARIVGEIIEECRRQVKEGLGDGEEARKFVVGIKLNSADWQTGRGGNAEETDTDTTEEVLRQIELFEQWGVDFVEVSGGSYEDPQMANGPKPEEIKQKSERTKAREAFFLEFAKIIRTKFPQLPLMVTGGFRTRQGMEAALASDDCDMIGIGRPAIINPSLPANLILNPEVPDADARLFDKKVEPHWIFEKLGMKSVVGAGAEIGWYVGELKKLAKF